MNIEFITGDIETIYFRSSKEWYANYWWNRDNKTLAIISEEDEKYINSRFNSLKIHNIVDGDSVLFKESSFPKLFLKEINSNVKRVIKEDKATVIITDSKNLITKTELKDSFERALLVKENDTEDTYYLIDRDHALSVGINLPEFFEENNMTVVENAKYIADTITPKKLKLLEYYDKFSTTEQLVAYINNFLPTPTPEQKDALLSLLASEDPANIELGINMVRMFNISDCVFDIFKAMAGDGKWNSGQYLDKVNRSNVRWKYLMSLGEFNLSDLKKFNRYWHNCCGKLYKLYSLSFISLEQKKKCWIHAYCLEDYRRMESEKEYFAMSESDKRNLSDGSLIKYGFPQSYANIT